MKKVNSLLLLMILAFLAALSITTQSCTKTKIVDKIVTDTVYVDKSTTDTVIVSETKTDTIIVNTVDTQYVDKVVNDTIILGADIDLPAEVNTFLTDDAATYQMWFYKVENYYDGYVSKTIHMDAIVVFYGKASLTGTSFDSQPDENKLMFVGFYQDKIYVTMEYNTISKTLVNEESASFGGPGLKVPDGFLSKNQLVDVWGSKTAFIVNR